MVGNEMLEAGAPKEMFVLKVKPSDLFVFGISDKPLNEVDVVIFPNPAKDILTISCENTAIIEEVVIYNQTGQKVFVGELVNNTIDVSNLPNGMYIVELVAKEWQIRKKLIIR